MTVSPEQYVANAIVKALFIGIFAIPFLFFAPILSLLIAVIAVVIYFTEYKKVGKIIRGKRQRIEYELPRLVSSIDKTLTHSRDVLGILDSYREHAGEELRRELDITVADMRSGNYEVALTRLETGNRRYYLGDRVFTEGRICFYARRTAIYPCHHVHHFTGGG